MFLIRIQSRWYSPREVRHDVLSPRLGFAWEKEGKDARGRGVEFQPPRQCTALGLSRVYQRCFISRTDVRTLQIEKEDGSSLLPYPSKRMPISHGDNQ
jgi:hypothetical protein